MECWADATGDCWGGGSAADGNLAFGLKLALIDCREGAAAGG